MRCTDALHRPKDTSCPRHLPSDIPPLRAQRSHYLVLTVNSLDIEIRQYPSASQIPVDTNRSPNRTVFKVEDIVLSLVHSVALYLQNDAEGYVAESTGSLSEFQHRRDLKPPVSTLTAPHLVPLPPSIHDGKPSLPKTVRSTQRPLVFTRKVLGVAPHLFILPESSTQSRSKYGPQATKRSHFPSFPFRSTDYSFIPGVFSAFAHQNSSGNRLKALSMEALRRSLQTTPPRA